VRLSPEQRERLLALTRNGAATAKAIAHARVLLLADENHPDGQRTDPYIATATGLHRRTLVRIRQRFVQSGDEAAVARKARETPPTPPKLSSADEAHLVALACSDPPDGRARWTLRLLAEHLSTLGVVTSVCAETVRKVLKKTC
jgi:hypothetical protein